MRNVLLAVCVAAALSVPLMASESDQGGVAVDSDEVSAELMQVKDEIEAGEMEGATAESVDEADRTQEKGSEPIEQRRKWWKFWEFWK